MPVYFKSDSLFYTLSLTVKTLDLNKVEAMVLKAQSDAMGGHNWSDAELKSAIAACSATKVNKLYNFCYSPTFETVGG